MSIKATCLGHPRMGVARELKKALESFWSGRSKVEELLHVASALRRRHLSAMLDAGMEHIPIGDFSLYDPMLDMAVAVSAVPERYRRIDDPAARYFAMARGLQDPGAGIDVPALEMTKWFDTNYHYIVPELEERPFFALDATKLRVEIEEAHALGITPRPVIPGPVTFLLLSKLAPGHAAGASTLDALEDLLPIYEKLLGILALEGIPWVQLDEPCLVLDLDPRAHAAYRRALSRLGRLASGRRPKLLLTTYFGSVEENADLVEFAIESGIEGLHVDLVRAPQQLDRVLRILGPRAVLSAGVVDGRNVWRTDLDAAHAVLRRAVTALGSERVFAAPSCSLVHVPASLEAERKLDPELKSWLAFAAEKLGEVRALADEATEPTPRGPRFEQARAALENRRRSPRTTNPAVRTRVEGVTDAMRTRASHYPERARKQRARFELPLLPTTTIGSFPQTGDVRGARAAFRAGKLDGGGYDAFLRDETRRCIETQEAIGLDVLVHGEFERTDMVEYFGEQLDGYAFTEHGWVQSYGSRCVKPPILYGDVARPKPMTVRWSSYAQSLTPRPVKGMLTGPVTILQWSFVRDDQPRSATCAQLALALRDEIADLEAAGIAIVQVDEPAIREGLPLRRADWNTYLAWAVDAFRLATGGVRDETQIHTHMCYSEFGDILEAIAAMDADVVSIETSRSKMELLGAFGHFRYPNEIGPGVYDIHSPRVPTREEIVDLLQRAIQVIPVGRLWVNPDCGLKTRGWPEVEAALHNMVAAARTLR